MIKKHAIVVHLYYNDLWEEFKSKIEPILERGDVDLYVTLTEDDTSAKEEIEKLTDKVYVLENRGLDVGPFLFVMNEIKDLNYTSIFKIQTKKSLHHGQDPDFGPNWRRQLVDALLGDIEVFDEITKILEDEPISMIGSKLHLVDFKWDGVNIPHHYDVIHKTIKELNINIKETPIGNSVCFSKKGRFFKGTMFATSHKYIKEIFKNCDMIEFYKSLPLGYVYDSGSHALERIFGYYIDELEGNFYEIDNTEELITFVATSHKETIEAHQFISSLLLQTNPRWKCIIYNDGENNYIKNLVENFNDKRIKYIETKTPKKFWGHYNRIDALNYVETEYVIQTSIQDYYTPNTVEQILKHRGTDFIYFDCLHNHFFYEILKTKPIICRIDWGCFALKTELEKNIGINHPENQYCDGLFVEECFRRGISNVKIDLVMTIHN